MAEPTAAETLASIPYLDLTVSLDSESDVEEGARQVLAHFIPDWAAGEHFTLQTVTDGLTNKLYKVKSEHGKILVRVYGANTEKLIDREQEMLTMISLSKLGLYPELHGRFNNGICYGYLAGTTFTPDDMTDDVKAPLVAGRCS
jgi:ethanolamine kinase